MLVAVVGTGAAGVNDSLLRSGSSSDLRLRGDPGRPPEGEVGLDVCGETCPRWGMGRRRFGACRLEDEPERPRSVPPGWREGEPWAWEGVFPILWLVLLLLLVERVL